MAKVEDIKDLWIAQENTEALKLLKVVCIAGKFLTFAITKMVFAFS